MYPIWLSMFMPPYIFITIISYLIIILIILFIFKIKNIKQVIFKSLVSTIITNILSSIILILLSSISTTIKQEIFYNHSKIYIALLIFILLLSGSINYLIHKKYILKNNKLICLIISIIFIPYFVLIPLKENKNIIDYKNTYIGDNSKVSTIIELLDLNKTSMSLQTTNEPFSLTIDLNDKILITNVYKTFERDSAIMFNLITNVSIINYNYKDKIYTFEYDKLNEIYDNLRDIEIDSINKRYDNFNDDYIYMGHIGDYDIFDESTFCELNEELVKKENNINYYITCSNLNDIYLYQNDQKYKLKDKLNELKISDLLMTDLNIYSK